MVSVPPVELTTPYAVLPPANQAQGKPAEKVLFKKISDLKLTSEQIKRNAAILYTDRYVTVDGQGNLEQRSFFAKAVNLSDSETAKFYEAVLATLEGIQETELPLNKWTFRYNAGKPFQIGYDKLAMNILTARYTYDHKHDDVLCAIENAALEVLQKALEFRMKRIPEQRMFDQLLPEERA